VFPGEHMQVFDFVQNWEEPENLVKRLNDYKEKGVTLEYMVTGLGISDDVFIESFRREYAGGNGDIKYHISLVKNRAMKMRVVPPKSVDNSGDGGGGDGGSKSGKYGTVTLNNKNSNLNVRKGAGMSYAIIGKLKHNTKVEILSKSGSWYQIPYGSGKGWVHSSYVKVISQPSSSTTTNTNTAGGQPSAGSTYTVKAGDSLYSIAKAKLGSGPRYTEIYKLNQAAIDARNKGKPVSKYTIYAGQVFKIPSK